MKVAIVCIVLIASVLAQYTEFEEFQLTYKKVYKNDNELQSRQKIFEENKRIIDEHNQRYAKGLETFEMGVNQFTDLTSSEFQNLVLGNYSQNPEYMHRFNDYRPIKHKRIPKSVNWVDRGAVTPVKDQGECGDCWVFATVGTLEGQYFRKTGKLLNLSEQNLLDCSSRFGNRGCKGGNAVNALQYVVENGGIQTAETYPYEARKGMCRYRAQCMGFKIKGFQFLEPDNEYSLAALVAQVGPIAVTLNAATIHFYKRGVYHGPCHNYHNHEVTLVGYGHDSDGGDYWLLKNSWGKNWGENGYIRLARNKGMCGIGRYAIYPTLE